MKFKLMKPSSFWRTITFCKQWLLRFNMQTKMKVHSPSDIIITIFLFFYRIFLQINFRYKISIVSRNFFSSKKKENFPLSEMTRKFWTCLCKFMRIFSLIVLYKVTFDTVYFFYLFLSRRKLTFPNAST